MSVVDVSRLKDFVERVMKLDEEKKALGDDRRQVLHEIKGAGFDVVTVLKVIKLLNMDSATRDEQAELLLVYARALGIDGTEALGLLPATDSNLVSRAADLFNAGRTVRDVAEALDVGISTAGRLRQKCEERGLLADENGELRPRASRPTQNRRGTSDKPLNDNDTPVPPVPPQGSRRRRPAPERVL